MTKEYVLEQSNTDSDDQQNTDKTIDEGTVDAKSQDTIFIIPWKTGQGYIRQI